MSMFGCPVTREDQCAQLFIGSCDVRSVTAAHVVRQVADERRKTQHVFFLRASRCL